MGCGRVGTVSQWSPDVASPAAIVGRHGSKVRKPAQESAQIAARAASPAIPKRIVSGNTKEKVVALTFDDGPHEGFTESLIRTLVADSVKATFFFIGRNVQRSPHLARLAADRGFEIGNHSMNHLRIWELGESEVGHEVKMAQDAIVAATGVRPRWFRPPGGIVTPALQRALDANGLSLALWSADAADYTRPYGNPTPDQIYRKVVREVRPGTIVILHDPMPSTLQALPLIVAELRARGYEFVTLSEIASRPGAVTTGPAPRVSHGSAMLARDAENRARYPFDQAIGTLYENPKQRTPGASAPKGQTRQRTDPGRDR
jgi:peptidoglycan/xylan/chitin deacetylase (PgdA/CDA1 family)